MEYLIPFLLTAQYSINDPNVYYAPEYVFNFTKNWERHYDNSTVGHGNILTILKCQNSSLTSIICFVENSWTQTYIEVPGGTTKPSEPKFVRENCEKNSNRGLCEPFEIVFDKNGVTELVAPNDTDKSIYGSWWEMANQLNVLWITKIDLGGQLVPSLESTIHGKCNATIKASKEKLGIEYLDKSKKFYRFKIDIDGGFDGMRLIYKKTRDVKTCTRGKKVLMADANSFLIYSLEMAMMRVVVSEYEFSSMFEDEISFILPDMETVINHHKIGLTLTEIGIAGDKIPPVKNPKSNLFTSG
ncbi:uncharacterized protein LOC103578418 [Microplitis demolitor]|uniref:uncharacterized protein LOC103578418 n=1 Tax=Microplitis demolitor TaxID=69319 RepID=UPI0004CD7451|nr:uncharacterized protein LOC103578418 [Microplitis demolitor]